MRDHDDDNCDNYDDDDNYDEEIFSRINLISKKCRLILFFFCKLNNNIKINIK